MVDPVTGGFSVGVPLTSVETLNVFEAPYNSQYGGFSGGLATIETKAPPSPMAVFSASRPSEEETHLRHSGRDAEAVLAWSSAPE
jgi:hypothetical protein